MRKLDNGQSAVQQVKKTITKAAAKPQKKALPSGYQKGKNIDKLTKEVVSPPPERSFQKICDSSKPALTGRNLKSQMTVNGQKPLAKSLHQSQATYSESGIMKRQPVNDSNSELSKKRKRLVIEKTSQLDIYGYDYIEPTQSFSVTESKIKEIVDGKQTKNKNDNNNDKFNSLSKNDIHDQKGDDLQDDKVQNETKRQITANLCGSGVTELPQECTQDNPKQPKILSAHPKSQNTTLKTNAQRFDSAKGSFASFAVQLRSDLPKVMLSSLEIQKPPKGTPSKESMVSQKKASVDGEIVCQKSSDSSATGFITSRMSSGKPTAAPEGKPSGTPSREKKFLSPKSVAVDAEVLVTKAKQVEQEKDDSFLLSSIDADDVYNISQSASKADITINYLNDANCNEITQNVVLVIMKFLYFFNCLIFKLTMQQCFFVA